MDTRFWGPSGWKLLHLIAYNYPSQPTLIDKQKYGMFYSNLKYVLPCKYCRISLTGFMEELPIEKHIESKKQLTKWIYLIHNKVNDKLRGQGLLTDKNPPLSEVDTKYEDMLKKKCQMPGWDFLYSIAFNYPKTKSDISFDKMQHYIVFFKLLGEVIPCPKYKTLYIKYTKQYVIEQYLGSGRELTKWLYSVNCGIDKELKRESKSYRRVCFVIESYRAKACSKKNHKGKTCRKKTSVKSNLIS
jgi:hypothetical protein